MIHGTKIAYNEGCRCDDCRTANTRWCKEYELRTLATGRTTMPVTVCRDRLRQLRSAGYSLPFLAAQTGLNMDTLRAITNLRRIRVSLGTYQAIERAWHTHREFPGPSQRAQTWGGKHGWAPPAPLPAPPEISEDDVDEIAVERACAGDPVPLTRAESAEAYRRLERLGLSAREIATRLHTSRKSVERWRSGEIRRPSSSQARRSTPARKRTA